MNPLAWLISLVLPACGYPATAGLPVPPMMDITHIARPSSPNTSLAAPQGFSPPPDIVTPLYKVSADRLFALVRTMADGQSRTYQSAVYASQLQVHYVARSAIFNFPDLIMVQVNKVDPDSSSLIVYSRSVYGHSDLGVNRRRVETWLALLQAQMPLSKER